MVFAGTALLLATAGLGYVALVHGVSAARLREGRRGWDAVTGWLGGGFRGAFHTSWLVVWNIFYFPICWEFHHPN